MKNQFKSIKQRDEKTFRAVSKYVPIFAAVGPKEVVLRGRPPHLMEQSSRKINQKNSENHSFMVQR